jgi:hypothetical protein
MMSRQRRLAFAIGGCAVAGEQSQDGRAVRIREGSKGHLTGLAQTQHFQIVGGGQNVGGDQIRVGRGRTRAQTQSTRPWSYLASTLELKKGLQNFIFKRLAYG